MTRHRIYFALPAAFVVCLVGTAMAAEINGKVVEATATTARITTESDLLPNPGDAVEIYFEIPGLDEPVSVASGKVRSAGDGGAIDVTIEKSSGKVAPNHLARITSAAPKRRGTPKTTTAPQPAGSALPPLNTNASVPPKAAASPQPPGSAGAALVGPGDATRQLLPAVAKLLPERHFSRRLLDDEVSLRWLANYLQELDPYKSYFLKSDIDRFLTRRDELDDLCRQGDASVAYDVIRVYLARLDERTALARELIAEPHDFTLPEEWTNDFEAAKYAANDTESRELWRKRIKYEILVQKVDGASDADATARVIRRFDAYRRRIQETDDDDLLSWYLTSLAMAYDPLSSFLSAKRVEDFEIINRQQLEGIGAQLKSVDGDTVIVRVVPGGPAAGDGRLKAGDKIVGVGQGESGALVDVSGRKLNDVVAQIRGKSGTIVRLQVISKGQTESVTYNLVRQRLQSDEARGTVLERGQKSDGTPFQVGYIRLSNLYSASFQGGRGEARTSTTDVRRLLEDLQSGFKARGVAVVILDLRDNSGGPLLEAISLPGLFINSGPIMQVKGTDGKVEQYDDDSQGAAWEGPLVVLTNRQTGSGAEIVAGAIQDYGRGLVIGDSSTSGNGTVQSMLDIGKLTVPDAPPKLGMLKVTTQQFYRVSGESVQRRGIVADVVLPSATEALKTGEMVLPGALPPDAADPARYAKLDLVTAEQKADLQARSNKRRESSAEYQQLAAAPTPPKRTSVVLTEDGVREELRRTAALEEPLPATTAVFRPSFDNQEIVSVALDYLHLQLVARGRAAFAKGSHAEAVSAYREAVQIDPKAAEVQYHLAWILATCPEKKVRDGRRAVEAAQAACTLSENKVWRHLLALAAAHAEAGDFASARTSLQKMLDLAPAADGTKYRYLLDRFAKGQAF